MRVQVSKNFRIPDVTVLDRSLPVERIITHAPIAVFEVLSPEDNAQRMQYKLTEYAKMGIPQIFVVDPETAIFERFEAGRLNPATRFEQGQIQFDLSEIAKFLQG